MCIVGHERARRGRLDLPIPDTGYVVAKQLILIFRLGQQSLQGFPRINDAERPTGFVEDRYTLQTAFPHHRPDVEHYLVGSAIDDVAAAGTHAATDLALGQLAQVCQRDHSARYFVLRIIETYQTGIFVYDAPEVRVETGLF
jgi:hypothetical protein